MRVAREVSPPASSSSTPGTERRSTATTTMSTPERSAVARSSRVSTVRAPPKSTSVRAVRVKTPVSSTRGPGAWMAGSRVWRARRPSPTSATRAAGSEELDIAEGQVPAGEVRWLRLVQLPPGDHRALPRHGEEGVPWPASVPGRDGVVGRGARHRLPGPGGGGPGVVLGDDHVGEERLGGRTPLPKAEHREPLPGVRTGEDGPVAEGGERGAPGEV